jgi:hypothetical protein
MQIIVNKITLTELLSIAEGLFGEMVKAVVDVSKEIIAIDAELHADLEALLLEAGSRQRDVWGVNLYPQLPERDFIEFDSMINVRPSQGNRSRGVDDEAMRRQIAQVVKRWVIFS